MKDYLQSRTITKILIVLGIILIALLSFQGGVMIGYHQGIFLHARDIGYERDLTDPRSILAPFLHNGDDLNTHGAIGEIVRIASTTFMLKDPSSTSEQIVSFTPTTTLRLNHEQGSANDLKTGDHVIVIGEPDNGEILASFIRILPPSPQGLPASSTRSLRLSATSSIH